MCLRRGVPPHGRGDEDYARSLPGFVTVEPWTGNDGGVVNAVYDLHDRESVALLARYPDHRQVKSHVHRWYDGYRIIIGEVTATYDDARRPGPTT